MNEQPTAAILLIHGTFAAAEQSEGVRWWQSRSQFWDWLNRELAGVAVCRDVFHWSGRNRERDRREAGRKLLDQIRGYERQSIPYYLIGHSHGGSVIWSALRDAALAGEALPRLRGWVTVGTPFLSYRVKWGDILFLVPLIAAGLALLPVLGQASVVARHVAAMWADGHRWTFLGLGLIWATVLACFVFAAYRTAAFFWACAASARDAVGDRRAAREFGDRWLGLWSAEDEAINGLRSSLYLGELRRSGRPVRLLPRSKLPLFADLGDRLFFEWLKVFVQGNDQISRRLAIVTPAPPGVALHPPLSEDLHRRLLDQVARDVDFPRTLDRLRRLLGGLAFGGQLDSPFESNSGEEAAVYTTLMVHTLYFPGAQITEESAPIAIRIASFIRDGVHVRVGAADVERTATLVTPVTSLDPVDSDSTRAGGSAIELAVTSAIPTVQPMPSTGSPAAALSGHASAPEGPHSQSRLSQADESMVRAPALRRLFAATAVQRTFAYGLILTVLICWLSGEALFDRVRPYIPEDQVRQMIADSAPVVNDAASDDEGFSTVADWSLALAEAARRGPQLRAEPDSLRSRLEGWAVDPVNVRIQDALVVGERVDDIDVKAWMLARVAETLAASSSSASAAHLYADRARVFARQCRETRPDIAVNVLSRVARVNQRTGHEDDARKDATAAITLAMDEIGRLRRAIRPASSESSVRTIPPVPLAADEVPPPPALPAESTPPPPPGVPVDATPPQPPGVPAETIPPPVPPPTAADRAPVTERQVNVSRPMTRSLSIPITPAIEPLVSDFSPLSSVGRFPALLPLESCKQRMFKSLSRGLGLVGGVPRDSYFMTVSWRHVIMASVLGDTGPSNPLGSQINSSLNPSYWSNLTLGTLDALELLEELGGRSLNQGNDSNKLLESYQAVGLLRPDAEPSWPFDFGMLVRLVCHQRVIETRNSSASRELRKVLDSWFKTHRSSLDWADATAEIKRLREFDLDGPILEYAKSRIAKVLAPQAYVPDDKTGAVSAVWLKDDDKSYPIDLEELVGVAAWLKAAGRVDLARVASRAVLEGLRREQGPGLAGPEAYPSYPQTQSLLERNYDRPRMRWIGLKLGLARLGLANSGELSTTTLVQSSWEDATVMVSRATASTPWVLTTALPGTGDPTTQSTPVPRSGEPQALAAPPSRSAPSALAAPPSPAVVPQYSVRGAVEPAPSAPAPQAPVSAVGASSSSRSISGPSVLNPAVAGTLILDVTDERTPLTDISRASALAEIIAVAASLSEAKLLQDQILEWYRTMAADEGSGLVDELKHSEPLRMALRHLSAAFMRRGEVDQALAIADEIPDNIQRLSARLYVALQLARGTSEQRMRARAIVDRAEREIKEKIPRRRDRSFRLSVCSAVWAFLGETGRGMQARQECRLADRLRADAILLTHFATSPGEQLAVPLPEIGNPPPIFTRNSGIRNVSPSSGPATLVSPAPAPAAPAPAAPNS